MGYEVYYNPEKRWWDIWSTIVDDWVGIGLKSPEDVANFFIEQASLKLELEFEEGEIKKREIRPGVEEVVMPPIKSKKWVKVRLTHAQVENIRRIWVAEAEKAKRENKCYVELLSINMETGERKLGVKKAP